MLFPTNIPKYLLCLICFLQNCSRKVLFNWGWQSGDLKAAAVVKLKWSTSLCPSDWEPPPELPRPSKSTSGPRRRNRGAVSRPVRAGFPSAPPGQPPIVLREPQHGGIPAAGDPGWGRVGSAGHAGLVSEWGLHLWLPASHARPSAPQTPPDFSRHRLHLNGDL